MHALVVDNEASLRGVLRDLLTEIGYRCVSFVLQADAFAADIEPPHIDVVVLDLEPHDAAKARRRAVRAFPRTPVVTIGGCDYEPVLAATFEVLTATRRRRSDRDRQQIARMRRLEKSNDELERIACIDPLTGLANRRHFDTLYSAEWRRNARRGRPLSVVMLDLDFFHAFNEHYGHPGGDACLRRVADAVTRCLRRPSDIIARYGGEEFIALLPDTDGDGACVAAERLRARVEQLSLPHAGSVCSSVVTASAGVATTVPDHGRSCRTLIAAADCALLRAKSHGRNRIGVDGPHAGAVIVKPPNRQPGPIVIAHPVLAKRIPIFLATKCCEVASLRARCDFASTAAVSRDLQRSGRRLGLGPLIDLGERLEAANDSREDGCVDGRVTDVLDELAWHLDHLQVVYQQPGPRLPDTLDEIRKPDHDLQCS